MILLDLLKIMSDREYIVIYLNDGNGNKVAEHVGILGLLQLPPQRYGDKVVSIRRENCSIEIEVIKDD